MTIVSEVASSIQLLWIVLQIRATPPGLLRGLDLCVFVAEATI